MAASNLQRPVYCANLWLGFTYRRVLALSVTVWEVGLPWFFIAFFHHSLSSFYGFV
jgi:hypothetical protein